MWPQDCIWHKVASSVCVLSLLWESVCFLTVCVSSSDRPCAAGISRTEACAGQELQDFSRQIFLLQRWPRGLLNSPARTRRTGPTARPLQTPNDAVTLPHEGALTDWQTAGGSLSSSHLKKKTIRTESVLLSHWTVDWNISKCSRNCVVLYFFICIYWFVCFLFEYSSIKTRQMDFFGLIFSRSHLYFFTSHRLSVWRVHTRVSWCAFSQTNKDERASPSHVKHPAFV